jgi:hypothetical protein
MKLSDFAKLTPAQIAAMQREARRQHAALPANYSGSFAAAPVKS